MFKKTFLFLVAIIITFGISKVSLAMMCGSGQHSSHQQTAQAETEHKHEVLGTTEQGMAKEPVDAGNKICPVSGEKIDQNLKVTHEHEGKVYNFCCASCIDEFKKDPDKYIKKVDEELKSESEAKSEEHMMMPESEMSEGMHGSGHQHQGN